MNYKIKKIIFSGVCVIVLLLFSTNIVYAGIMEDAASRMTPIREMYHGSSEEITPAEIIAQVISYALSFLGVLFLSLLIYAGFLWMTAAGDQEKITKAKDILQSSVIGLIIIISSYTITYFVLQNLTKAAGTYY